MHIISIYILVNFIFNLFLIKSLSAQEFLINKSKPSSLLSNALKASSNDKTPSNIQDNYNNEYTFEFVVDPFSDETNKSLLYRLFQNLPLKKENFIENLVNEVESEKREEPPESEETMRNRNKEALKMEKKLTEKQKKLITEAISNNFINKLKNIYVVTARSR